MFIDEKEYILNRFEESNTLPFRIAITTGNVVYGGHTEPRDYADHTVGYAHTIEQVKELINNAEAIQIF